MINRVKSVCKEGLRKFLPVQIFSIIEFISSFIFYIFFNFNKPVGSFLAFKFFIFIIFGIKKNWYEKSLDMTIIANEGVFISLIEVYNYGLYDSLENLESVLDLGAFIGESAVFLASRNHQVVCFEPSVEKFELVEKNKKKNIISYNAALTTSEEKQLDFFYSSMFDVGASLFGGGEGGLKSKVNSIHIREIMTKYSFDGLKVDIEGGEFDLLLFFLDGEKDLFSFKKGVIEFHFHDQLEVRLKIFNKFIEYLSGRGAEYKCFDNYGAIIDINTLLPKVVAGEIQLFNLEFLFINSIKQ